MGTEAKRAKANTTAKKPAQKKVKVRKTITHLLNFTYITAIIMQESKYWVYFKLEQI